MPAKDFLCRSMPSCLEAGQRAKLNRTCHSAQASLRSLLLEESCIRKRKPKFKFLSEELFADFLPRKSAAAFAAKRNEHLKDKKKINIKENNENNPRQTLSLAGIVFVVTLISTNRCRW
ncbi:hypothetical protein [Phascolarctobacterium sp.]